MNRDSEPVQEYPYVDARPSYSSTELSQVLIRVLAGRTLSSKRAIDVGCGNGSMAQLLHGLGFEVLAVDPSTSGIAQARRSHPEIEFHVASAYDDLAGRFGTFPLVVSFEVVEHCYWPRKFARALFELLEPGGTAIVSTPYHGYAKNLALALLNRMDAHWSPLWDGGHIKFWSIRTLSRLLNETGFVDASYLRVGRIAPLAKSLVAVCSKRT